MKKYALIPLIVLVALFAGAGKYKISKVGQPDVYVPTLDSDAKTLTVENITGPGSVPIGGMVAVMPNIDAANAWQPPSSGVIKDGFMRADGVTIAASHRNAGCKLAVGTKLPNMINSYPRGNTTSTNGTTGMGGSNAGHYHGMGSGTLSVSIDHDHGSQSFTSGTVSADHTHTWSTTGGGHEHDYVHPDEGAGVNYGSNYLVGGLRGFTTSGGGSHSHSGTTSGISANHTHSTPVDLSNFTGSKTPTGSIGNVSTGFDGNAAGSNEPAYVETVWVIRVK